MTTIELTSAHTGRRLKRGEAPRADSKASRRDAGALIRLWSTGPEVVAWQFMVSAVTGRRLAVDGVFGPKTDAATRAFQGTHGLTIDGVVGPATMRAAIAARWYGAQLDPRGSPVGSILAVRGLSAMTPRFRAQLVALCEELAIPADSVAAVISSESGFDPKAHNPLPACGLIQLTLGAHLPGFNTKARILSILDMSAEEQLDLVVRPYYARMKRAHGAHPGHLYMLNFLPNDANQSEAFPLGIRGDIDKRGGLSWRGKIYDANKGFDRGKKGYFTIGDVYAVAAMVCKNAKGARLAATMRGRKAA